MEACVAASSGDCGVRCAMIGDVESEMLVLIRRRWMVSWVVIETDARRNC